MIIIGQYKDGTRQPIDITRGDGCFKVELTGTEDKFTVECNTYAPMRFLSELMVRGLLFDGANHKALLLTVGRMEELNQLKA